jgi:hypothetical protein
MRPEPRLTPDAQADVLAAARFYESERAGLGFEFLDEVSHTLSLISTAEGPQPKACKHRRRGAGAPMRFAGIRHGQMRTCEKSTDHQRSGRKRTRTSLANVVAFEER